MPSYLPHPHQLILRQARPEEEPEVRRLTLAAYAEYGSLMHPEAWAELDQAVRGALDGDQGARCIVAEVAGELVGSVRLYPPAATDYEGATQPVPWPELRLLAVDPQLRGGGVGRALVEECIRCAREAGATALGLHTSVSMRPALRLYQRLGFARDPERDFQPQGAEEIMAFRLLLEPAPRGAAQAVAENATG